MDLTLYRRLRDGAGPLWADYIGHPFVRGLGDGTLPQAAFRRYLTQDYLFLIHFVRAYSLAGYKSTRLDDLHAASAGMGALLAEMQLHVAYCRAWGLDEAAMAAEPEAVETVAYTRFVLERGTAGDLLDLHVALAPCVLGYAEIGAALAPCALADNPYAAWLTSYAGIDYRPPSPPRRRWNGSAPAQAPTPACRTCSGRSIRPSGWRRHSGTWGGWPDDEASHLMPHLLLGARHVACEAGKGNSNREARTAAADHFDDTFRRCANGRSDQVGVLLWVHLRRHCHRIAACALMSDVVNEEDEAWHPEAA